MATLCKDIYISIALQISDPATLLNFGASSKLFYEIFKRVSEVKRKEFRQVIIDEDSEYTILPNGNRDGICRIYLTADLKRYIASEMEYNNAVEHGRFKNWYHNGELWEKGFSRNGSLSGKITTYWNSDSLKNPYNKKAKNRKQEYYIGQNGNLIGLEREWDENGNLTKKCRHFELEESWDDSDDSEGEPWW